MDGENSGKPLFFNGWFGGKTHHFRKPPWPLGAQGPRTHWTGGASQVRIFFWRKNGGKKKTWKKKTVRWTWTFLFTSMKSKLSWLCVVLIAMFVTVPLHRLGGGFKHFLIFTLKIGEMIQFDDHIFQLGLKPPTRLTWLTRKITHFGSPWLFQHLTADVSSQKVHHNNCRQLFQSWIEPKYGKKLSYTSLAVASDTFLSRSFIQKHSKARHESQKT